MGATNQKISKKDKNSNSSVLDLSLESIKSIMDDSSSSDSGDKGNTKSKVGLPNENDNFESQEFLFEGKEEEIKLKLFYEDDKEEGVEKSIFFKKRKSKSLNVKNSIRNAPKTHLKISNELISPLKLNSKNFGNCQKWSRKLNAILYDFQKNIIECKSCNDEDKISDDDFLIDSETERTTPNLEDLQNLLDCRKKMKIFRNSINDRNINEYENILNIDYLFCDNDEGRSSNHHKKTNFWQKHIKQQQEKYSKSILSSDLGRLSQDSIIKRSESLIETNKDHGLFILGILESAANDKKMRNTVNV